MEAIKNAIGMSSTTAEPGKEPVNADQGEGTATQPFDGGNKEEVSPTTNGDAAATNTASAGAPVTAVDSGAGVNPTQAIGASATKTADEIGGSGTEKPVDGLGAAAEQPKSDTVLAEVKEKLPTDTSADPVPATEHPEGVADPSADVKSEQAAASTAPAVTTGSAAAAETKDKKSIGSASWFKSTLQRRKSKGNTLESEKPPKVPEKDRPEEKAAVAASAATAATAAAVAHQEPKESEKVKEPASEKAEHKQEPKKEHKRAKSVSETLKSANPFKRRQSKAETKAESKAKDAKAEPIKEETPAAVVLPPNHVPADVPAGTAAPAAADESPPVGPEPTVSEQPTSEAAPSRYADEDIAPDAMPATATTAGVASESTAAETTAPEAGADHTPAGTKITVDNVASSESPAVNEATAGPVNDGPSIQQETGRSKPSMASAFGENLSAIPTAGGVRLGERAFEQRKASVDVRRKSFVPADVPATENKPETIPEEKPAVVAHTEPTADHGHETRRLSVFDKLKDKLKL